MILTLQRRPQDPNSTPGSLGINGVQQCFTLELPVRDGLPGSAIPAGKYPIVLAPSPKFMASADAWTQLYASQMPHIEPIPGRSLIMLHWGNSPADTDGCILVGRTPATDAVWESRPAFAALYIEIQQAVRNEGCWIEVVDAPNTSEEVQDAVEGT